MSDPETGSCLITGRLTILSCQDCSRGPSQIKMNHHLWLIEWQLPLLFKFCSCGVIIDHLLKTQVEVVQYATSVSNCIFLERWKGLQSIHVLKQWQYCLACMLALLWENYVTDTNFAISFFLSHILIIFNFPFQVCTSEEHRWSCCWELGTYYVLWFKFGLDSCWLQRHTSLHLFCVFMNHLTSFQLIRALNVIGFVLIHFMILPCCRQSFSL